MKDGMIVRHETLRARPRCEHQWESREPDHRHTCEVFVGHLGHHSCRCGSGQDRRDVDRSKKLMGARAR
jgi:hypothetical protein